jgi:L-rhamnose-H+ transport protein
MISVPIALTFFAGFVHGTYVLPVRYMKYWTDENIWLVFAPIGFLVIPLISLILLDPHFYFFMPRIPHEVFLILILGGLSFGIGMVIFTYSLVFLGVGISFILNIFSGTLLSTLLPFLYLYPEKIWTKFGAYEAGAIFLFALGLLSSYLATMHRDKENLKEIAFLGVFLGIFSGVFTAAEGLSYTHVILKNKHSVDIFAPHLMVISWLIIFSSAFVPYFSFFLWKNIKKNSLKNIFNKKTAFYYGLCFLMGLFYFDSLLIFSHAATKLDQWSVSIAWPMLMICIVMTSNFWSFVHKEWEGAPKKAYLYFSTSFLVLIFASFLLAMANLND